MGNFYVYMVWGFFMVTFVFVFAFCWLLISYLKVLSNLKRLRERQRYVHTRAEEEAEELLEEARVQARKVLADAFKLGKEDQAKIVRVVEEELQKVLADVSSGLRPVLDEEVKNFGKNLVGELGEVRGEIEREYGEYKSQMWNLVEKRSRALVSEIVEKVLVGGMTKEKQEELVMSALVEMKKSLNPSSKGIGGKETR